MKERIRKRFNAWLYSDIAPSNDFEEFLEEHKKKIDSISRAIHPRSHDHAKELTLSFDMSYSQRQLTRATESLRNATWILALATVIFAGVELVGRESTIAVLNGLVAGILWAAVGLMTLALINLILRKTIRFFIGRKNKVVKKSAQDERL